MPDDPWFVPTWGYGARLVHWKGWAAIGAHLVAVVVLGIGCFAFGEPTLADTTVFFLGTVAATPALAFVAKAKTRGEWRWRSRKDAER